MVKTVTHEVQTTVGAYLKELPGALGAMDYEVRGNRVIAHSADGTVIINLTYEGERHLGSLDLPMTRVEVVCVGFSDAQAEAFLKNYDDQMMRMGGG